MVEIYMGGLYNKRNSGEYGRKYERSVIEGGLLPQKRLSSDTFG